MALLTLEHFQKYGEFQQKKMGEGGLELKNQSIDNHQFAVNFLLHVERAASLTNIMRLPSPPSFDYIDNKYYFTPEFAAGNM